MATHKAIGREASINKAPIILKIKALKLSSLLSPFWSKYQPKTKSTK